MQRTKILARVLRQLSDLLSEEAERNEAFRESLERILEPLPSRPAKPGTAKVLAKDMPDIYAEAERLGENDFRLWLTTLDVGLLKAIVKDHGFDPGRESREWVATEKFASLISEQLRARLRRGSGFMRQREGREPEPPKL